MSAWNGATTDMRGEVTNGSARTRSIVERPGRAQSQGRSGGPRNAVMLWGAAQAFAGPWAGTYGIAIAQERDADARHR